ncbi:MAG: phosphate transport system regulatory protein PhoU [Bacteroidetes bacterium]|jgi:phosphate transport system protein|nr:phosphate transport system regulatory protein PhoU [Bacteroidota bacterium]
MSHLDIELQQLKAETLKMWALVNLQLRKGKDSLVNLDKDLAREVILSERRVNAYELKLDRDCENIFALFNPVAVDLRCVLAVLKINNNLERTGDIVEGIAKFVTNVDNTFDKQILQVTRAVEMYEAAIDMMDEVMDAFDKENTSIARRVFQKDELLDDINLKANAAIAEYIRSNPDKIESALYLLSIIRKLERVGDQAKNMAEEIIFYIEAKVLKHRSKVEKQNNN